MRFLQPLAAVLSLAAFVPSVFAVDKIAKFQSLTKHAVVPLTDKLYDEITLAPRNYTAVVLLTALDARYGCQLCKEFQPEFELTAKSWAAKHRGNDGLFFSVLDFNVGKNTFSKLGLTTAPIMYLFPPTEGPDADPMHIVDPLVFEFTQNHVPAETLAWWISTHSVHEPKIQRPFNWTKLFISVTSLLVSATILKLSYKTLQPAIYSRNLWAAISLILILLFTSGHMFNHIRGVPYVVNDGRGGVSYIAGGFSNQFGMETQIVALVYAVLAFAAISLGLKMPRIEDPGRQKIAVWLWNAVLLVAFSFLMSLFRQKNSGYPFYLPPLM